MIATCINLITYVKTGKYVTGAELFACPSIHFSMKLTANKIWENG